MQDFPHHYVVAASAKADSNVDLQSPGLENLQSAGPAEFGGPGDLWSPETLLVAAVADCFILSFRAKARVARLDWNSLSCDVVGQLDRVEKVTRFTNFSIRATLEVPEGTNEDKALRLMEKAKKHCLITDSMIAESQLEATVRIAGLVA